VLHIIYQQYWYLKVVKTELLCACNHSRADSDVAYTQKILPVTTISGYISIGIRDVKFVFFLNSNFGW